MLSGKPADVSPQSPGVTSQGKLSQGRTLGWRAADQSYSWGWPAWAGASQRGVGGPGKIFEETVVENFHNMGKEIATQVQEVQRVPYRINPRRNMPRHVVIKLAKTKDREKLLKAAREK